MWVEITYPLLNFNGCTPWSLGMDKKFHPTLDCAWDYLSMLGLKLNHVSKRGPWVSRYKRQWKINQEAKKCIQIFSKFHCKLLAILFRPRGVDSLEPGRLEWNFRKVIFKLHLVTDGWGISCEIAHGRTLLDLTDDKSALVQVKASARQQAITWAKVDPDLCRHMTSLGRNVKDILSDTK